MISFPIFAFYIINQISIIILHPIRQVFLKKLIEKSRECHNHKPQPTPDTKWKRKMTKTTRTKQTNKCTSSTQTSSLFPKRGDHNAKRNDETWGQRAYMAKNLHHFPPPSICYLLYGIGNSLFVYLCWGLTSQSTIFQLCRDGATASWLINQYFWGVKCLAQGHSTAAVGFEPPTSRSGVRHSTTEPPRSSALVTAGSTQVISICCLTEVLERPGGGTPALKVMVITNITQNNYFHAFVGNNQNHPPSVLWMTWCTVITVHQVVKSTSRRIGEKNFSLPWFIAD